MNADIVNIIETVLKVNFHDISFEQDLRNIEGWDSLSHMLLILKLEEYLNLQLLEDEIESINKVGDIFKLVDIKKNI